MPARSSALFGTTIGPGDALAARHRAAIAICLPGRVEMEVVPGDIFVDHRAGRRMRRHIVDAALAHDPDPPPVAQRLPVFRPSPHAVAPASRNPPPVYDAPSAEPEGDSGCRLVLTYTAAADAAKTRWDPMAMTSDILIRGGTVIDGSGRRRGNRADVAIATGGSPRSAPTLPARRGQGRSMPTGSAVAPGFIDIKTHSDFTLPINPKAESKVRQGVTTEIIGHCGFSVAPVLPGKAQLLADYLSRRRAVAAVPRDAVSGLSRHVSRRSRSMSGCWSATTPCG